jgi:hypothetical protein
MVVADTDSVSGQRDCGEFGPQRLVDRFEVSQAISAAP